MKIAVLLGGTSAERDVSIVSGISIAKALVENGHTVEAIDCAYGDRIVPVFDEDISKVIAPIPPDIESKKAELDQNILVTADYLIKERFELVFNALHGGYGENGQLQALLELCHIPFTGSDSVASTMGMNKHFSKQLFQKNGIPTPPWCLINDRETRINETVNEIGLPVVIKPNNQGSTVGLTIVRSPEQIDGAARKAFAFGKYALIEKYIPDKELTVSILGNSPLPVIEIIPKSGLYDYESKYQSGKTEYVCPAKISEDANQKLQDFGYRAFKCLDCHGYARADFRMSAKEEIFCLEVNTLPGMTPTSLVPKAAQAVGMDFNHLIEKIARLGLEK
jgi:D-alanine-D-alanine ligase